MSIVLALLLTIPAFAEASAGKQDDAKKAEDEANKALEQFKTAAKKAKDDNDFVMAFTDLGKTKHPKIFAELKKWLSSGPTKAVRMAAADQIGLYREKEAAELLIAAATAQKEMEVAIRYLWNAGQTRVKTIAPKLISLYTHKETDIARQAIESSGAIKSKECIEPLIKVVKDWEAVNEADRQNGAQPGEYKENEKMVRKRALHQAAISALWSISGQQLETGKGWDEWWKKNKATFKELD